MNELIEFLQGHNLAMLVFCGLFGYLVGSVSFARVVYFLVKKSNRYEPFSEPIPHTDERFESDLISATWVTKKLGAKYGCATSLLDMAKVALPTLMVKLLFTTHPWFLLVALMGIAGHNFPVYYRFVGGRGESPIIGVLLVINWFGILLANLAATILGFITGSVLVVRWGGYILLIFWFWIYFNDMYYVVFMILTNVLFWLSMRKDLLKFYDLKVNRGIAFSEEEVSEFILMGRSLGRNLDRYSLYAIYKKWRRGKQK